MLKHYMSANEVTRCPRAHIALDAETFGRRRTDGVEGMEHRLMMGKALYFETKDGQARRCDWHTFRTSEELWPWVYSHLGQGKRVWLWSHWAAYDLTVCGLWRELEDRRLRLARRRRPADRRKEEGGSIKEQLGSLITSDPPTVLDLQSLAGHSLTVVDLMNWLPHSLQKIGGMIGLCKLSIPGDAAGPEAWDEYCERDVQIVAKAVCLMVKYVKDNDLGNFAYTIAGQSLAFFRHRCLDTGLLLGTDDKIKGLERSSYYGMACAARFAGAVVPRGQRALTSFLGIPDGTKVIEGSPVHRLDLNCAYPSQMPGRDYPIAFRHGLQDLTTEALSAALVLYEGCADVLLNSADEVFPIHEDGRLRLCRGIFRTTLCGPDLRRALLTGSVIAVYAAQVYKRGRPFDKWGEEYFALRDKYLHLGEEIYITLTKQIGNALHGKLGQKAPKWEHRPLMRSAEPYGVFFSRDADTGAVRTFRSVGYCVQERMPDGEHSGNAPLIAAYTTAYAREHVQRAIRDAGEREVVYQDADSIHVLDDGLKRLERLGWIHPVQPGKLKHVDQADVALYRGPKCYRHDGEWTVAGIRDTSKITFDGTVCQGQFRHLDGILDSAARDCVMETEVEKSLPAPTIDGPVSADGWVSAPFKR